MSLRLPALEFSSPTSESWIFIKIKQTNAATRLVVPLVALVVG
jgi:hypothetical protein